MSPLSFGISRAIQLIQSSGSSFPAAYQTLINSFATKYYVSTLGSDSNAGSESAPYATIGKALSVAGNNSAIIIKSGNYTVTNNGPGSYGERMFYTTSSVSIIGEPGKVIVTEASDLGARDNHIFGMANAGCKIYGLIIRRNNNGRSVNYSTAMWGYDASASYGEVYNCVVEETNANGIMSHVYDNSGSGGGKLYNCTIVASQWQPPYTCGSTNVTQNTALTSSNSFSLCGNGSGNVNGATINATTYSLTNYSNNTYGVYSGTYTWSTVITIPTGYVLAMSMNNSNGGRLSDSTWTLSQPVGSAATYVSAGGVEYSGYYSDSGRSVSQNYFRIDQMPVLSTTDLTFCIWYKGTQNVAPQTFGPSVPLFGDTRGTVYGGFGMSNGRCEFRDSGNAYQGPLVNTNVWTNIVFSMTTARTLKIYVNGSLTNTYTNVSVTTSYTTCSDIGAHYPYSGYVAPTAIDGVIVYNRILTDIEVLQVYNASNFS